MTARHRPELLFTGYAPVHFLCFRPLFERLRRDSSCRVYVSGGLRSKSDDGEMLYDAAGLYGPMGVLPDHVLTVDEIRQRDFDVLFAGNTKMIEPRSVGCKIQIFHGISFRNRAVRPENVGADHYFMVGPYMRRQFDRAGIIPLDDPRGVDVGFPKTDRLFAGLPDRRSVCERYAFNPELPLVLYAPTGQKGNSLELHGTAMIERLLATERVNLLVKLHDHPKSPSRDWAAELRRLSGPRFHVALEHDVVPLLAAADVLISDASSVSNEYSLVDRPMIFIDTPQLIEKAVGREGSMVDLDTWGRRAGTVVSDPGDLVRAVDEAVASPDRGSDLRRAMAEDLFFNPGRATEYAIEFLHQRVLSSPADLPMRTAVPG